MINGGGQKGKRKGCVCVGGGSGLLSCGPLPSRGNTGV